MDFTNAIQIAGVIDQSEADMLVECGVRYLGFPLRLPVHKEDLCETDAATIISNLPKPCQGILITYLNNSREIIEFCDFLGVSVVQLHGDISVAELGQLKQDRPTLSVIKSLVIGQRAIEELFDIVRASAAYVDAYITDTYDPATGASGATGKIHDWALSKRFVKESPRPIILAGGLNPRNVKDAIHSVGPAGVDSHTGVEDSNGRKSREKVMKFVAKARETFRELNRVAV